MQSFAHPKRAFRTAQHLPRRKRWWRKFASPMWMLLAAPVMLLPLWAVVAGEAVHQPSAVEQAVASLPLPGDASLPKDADQRFALLGSPTRQLPASTSLRLYADSARVASDAIRRTSVAPGRAQQDGNDVDALTFDVLHPKAVADDDLLVGNYALLTRSMSPDLSLAFFFEFCTAVAGDPGFGAKLSDLPLSDGMISALTTLTPGSGLAHACNRVG